MVKVLFDEISAVLFKDGPPSKPVPVYIAGGAAVFLYVNKRISGDVDADFAARVLLPDASVLYRDDAGLMRTIELDRTYSPTLGLAREDYDTRAVPTGFDVCGFDVKVLDPVDLAISKLSRFAEHDKGDIAALINAGLIVKSQFEDLANDAIKCYIGNMSMVRLSLRDALAMFAEDKATTGAVGPSSRPVRKAKP